MDFWKRRRQERQAVDEAGGGVAPATPPATHRLQSLFGEGLAS